MIETKSLQTAIAKEQLTRRKFLSSATAMGLSVATASSLWARTTEAAIPKKGGKFRSAVQEAFTSDSLDPSTYTTNFSIQLAYATRNYLVEFDANNDLVGDLAESWEASDDLATWSFKLRHGVEFHNGKSLTPDDVIDTLNFHRAEGSKSAAKALLQAIDEISADGSRVNFKLVGGNADFPYLFFDYHLPILPSNGEGSVDWQSGNGTGGYVLQSFEPGVSATVKRNTNYWKDGAAHFDEAEFLAIRDVTARTNALITGEIDAMDECDIKTVHLLERNSEIVVDEATSGQHQVLPMDMTVAPFDNNDVRLALKYAIDREAILQKVYRGHGIVGNDHPIPPTMKYFSSNIPQREYDPDKAKFHLNKAGLDGLKVKLHTGEVSYGAVDTAILYKEHATKADIDVDIAREPADGYWDNVWMVKPWCVSYWSARPTVDSWMSLIYQSTAAWNDTRFNNARFDEVLIAARAEPDEARRAEMYEELQRILWEEGGAVVTVFPSLVSARSAKIATPKSMSSVYALDGLRAIERWWFA